MERSLKRKLGNATAPHFPSVPLTEANRRASKHNKIVAEILSDFAQLDELRAIKIELSRTGQKKADLRAALHREAKARNINLGTTSDDKHLYIFHASPKAKQTGPTQ